jgi:aspartate-semialdehyde dehydrogenase
MLDLVIGVVGATGAVGQTALDILGDAFPGFRVAQLRAFASRSSVGKRVAFGAGHVAVEETRFEALLECDAVLFATEAAISREFIPRLAEAGVLCVDKSSAYRDDPSVPLVVPEVNGAALLPDALGAFPVVANPNCCATPLAVALAPLAEAYGLERVIVSTYQSVSGTGKQGIDVLNEETRAFLRSEDLSCHPSSVYPKSIAFNVMPFVAKILPSGDTDEEAKIVQETRKLLGLPGLPVSATSVRVPTFVGHAEAVTVELSRDTSLADVRALLARAPGVVLVDEFAGDAVSGAADAERARAGATSDHDHNDDDDEGTDEPTLFPTPRDVHGKDAVYVGRVRKAEVFRNGFALWIAADNLRKGAALNAIQIIDACSRNGTLGALRSRRGRS